MEHIYTAADYMGPFLVVCIGIVLIGGAAAVILGRFLKARFGRVWLGLLPLAGWMILFFLVMSWAVPILTQTGCLLIPSQRDTHDTAGRVEEIRSAPNTKLYYVNGNLRSAVFVTIDGGEYYVISEQLLKPGMDVAFTYAPEGNVILSWKQVTRQQAEAIQLESTQTPIQRPSDEPEAVTPEMELAGRICISVGVAGFVICLFLFIQLRSLLVGYARRKDARYRGSTSANPMGLAVILPPMLFLILFTIGECIRSGEYQSLFVPALALGMMACYGILSMTTQVRLEGKTLVIQRWNQEKRYPVEKITSVRWETRKSLTRRVLVISFSPLSYLRLNQDNHWGLGDFYDRLNSLLETKS